MGFLAHKARRSMRFHLRAFLLLVLVVGCSKANKDAVNLMNQGVRAYGGGDVNTAVQRLKQSLQLLEDSAQAHYNLGLILANNTDRGQEAKKHLNRSVQLDGTNHEAYYQLGKLYLKLGDSAMARESFDKAVRLNRRHAASLFELGLIAESEMALVNADRLYRQSIVANYQQPYAYLALGRMYVASGYLDEAKKVFQEGLRLCGDTTSLSNELGVLLVHTGADKEGAELLQRAAGSIPVARFNLSIALLRQGKIKTARVLLNDFIRTSQNDNQNLELVEAAKIVLQRAPR
jgi:tetratricopeptide (TPR) repeat protein